MINMLRKLLQRNRTILFAHFDDYELINISMESDELLHEFTGIGMAPASDTPSTSGLAPRKGSSRELHPGVNPCQRSPLSSPPLARALISKIFVGGNFVTSGLVMKITKISNPPPKISRYMIVMTRVGWKKCNRSSWDCMVSRFAAMHSVFSGILM